MQRLGTMALKCSFRKYGVLAMALFLASMSGSLRADLLSEVPKNDRPQLMQHQTVEKSIPMPGAPWPKFKLYRLINAPAATIWNLFINYEAQPSYIPDTIAVKVLAHNPDGSVNVQYTVKVPVLRRITYTVQDRYSHQGNLSKVSWKLIKSPLAKSSDGSFEVEPYGPNQSLVCYTNFCVPIIGFITGLQEDALDSAKKTVSAIATEAERRAAAAKIATAISTPTPSPSVRP